MGKKKRGKESCKRRAYKTQHQAVQAARAKDDGAGVSYCENCREWHLERYGRTNVQTLDKP